MTLHGCFRSGAAWRVRIALNRKAVAFGQAFHDLRQGEQKRPEFREALNPQGLVPALDTGAGAPLTQSLASLEWLEETRPDPPLLPRDPLERARVRAFALAICGDIHPVQNIGVPDRLRGLGLKEARVAEWVRGAVGPGLAACERAAAAGARGPVLLRRRARPRRHLPRPAARQRAALRGRPVGCAAAARRRGGVQRPARLRRGAPGRAAGRGVKGAARRRPGRAAHAAVRRADPGLRAVPRRGDPLYPPSRFARSASRSQSSLVFVAGRSGPA